MEISDLNRQELSYFEEIRRKNLYALIETILRFAIGFFPIQLINILLYNISKSLTLVVFLNLIYFFIILLLENIRVKKNVIIFLYLPLSISMLLMGFAFYKKDVILSSLLFISTSFLFNICVTKTDEILSSLLRVEKRGKFLKRFSNFGILITAFSVFLLAWILDVFPVSISVSYRNLYQIILSSSGIIIGFSIGSLLFIIVFSLLITHSKDLGEIKEKKVEGGFNFSFIFKNPLLISSSLFLASVILLFIYLGPFLYITFYNLTHPYLNVAIVIITGIIAPLFAPYITINSLKAFGKLPMLLFGLILYLIMPLAFYLQKDTSSIVLATLIGMVGVTISRMALDFHLRDISKEKTYKAYSRLINVLVYILLVILSIFSIFIVKYLSVKKVFLLILMLNLIFVIPTVVIYLIIFIKKLRK